MDMTRKESIGTWKHVPATTTVYWDRRLESADYEYNMFMYGHTLFYNPTWNKRLLIWEPDTLEDGDLILLNTDIRYIAEPQLALIGFYLLVLSRGNREPDLELAKQVYTINRDVAIRPEQLYLYVAASGLQGYDTLADASHLMDYIRKDG